MHALALVAALTVHAASASSGAADASAPDPGRPKVLRIAVQDAVTDGVPARVGALMASATVRELRKLDAVAVVSLDEVRALMEQEANRQLSGCSEDSCLGEIADALGADTIVTMHLSRVGAEHYLSLRRLHMSDATQTRSVERRFPAGGGEEFLSALGGAVEELFPDHTLRKGQSRGVPKEVAKRLNPPPLSPWVFNSALAFTGVTALTGAAAGSVTLLLNDQMHTALSASGPESPADGAELQRTFSLAQQTALAANVLWATAAGLGIVAGVSFFFTDFEGAGRDVDAAE